MLQTSQLSSQIELAGTDAVRTLIVGAGVAGATLAALMRKRGRHPVLIERAGVDAPEGYMLGLLPFGANALHTLDAYPEYLAASSAVGSCRLGDARGRLIRQVNFRDLFDAGGDLRGIERSTLIDVISGDGVVTRGVTVTALAEAKNDVAVTFSDGKVASFDLVVAADGLHSRTRSLVVGEREIRYRDTGWAGWVVWAELGDHPADSCSGYWGAGRFVGFFPVRGRVGILVSGPIGASADGPEAFIETFRRQAGPLAPAVEIALNSLQNAVNPFLWRFVDCRSERFAHGRVVLLGDSCAGFLPTAGVGAAMAMDSAAALDDELSRTDAAHVRSALELYERRQHPRVLAAQNDARTLARVMFTQSRLMAWVIRSTTRLIGPRLALGRIRRVMAGRR